MEDVVVDTAGGRNVHAMVDGLLSLMNPEGALRRVSGVRAFPFRGSARGPSYGP
ncbi:hypothetical protein AB6813_21840 [bacterium RCC_150]